MADTAISGLTGVASVLSTQQFPVNDSNITKSMTVAQLQAYMSTLVGWRFLGQAVASAAARTGDVTWTGSFDELMIEYIITGYAGGAIGRILLADTAISETATTECCELVEGGTRNTTAVSIPGWPTAVTSGTVARYGVMFITNKAGTQHRMSGHGQHSGTAATVVPTGMILNGLTSITAQYHKARMTSFTAITGTTVGSTFNAGTLINVWGRNND